MSAGDFKDKPQPAAFQDSAGDNRSTMFVSLVVSTMRCRQVDTGKVSLSTSEITYGTYSECYWRDSERPRCKTTDANGAAVSYQSLSCKDKRLVQPMFDIQTKDVTTNQSTFNAANLQWPGTGVSTELIVCNSDPRTLDETIASVDKFRSSLGAVQNRLDSAVANLNNTYRLSGARSIHSDADYATKCQICLKRRSSAGR